MSDHVPGCEELISGLVRGLEDSKALLTQASAALRASEVARAKLREGIQSVLDAKHEDPAEALRLILEADAKSGQS